MHEYSIVSALIERVSSEVEKRGPSVVTRLWVQVGDLSGVDPELLRTAYETFRERTVCEAAALELERVPVRWACSRCECPIPSGTALRCPECESPAKLFAGDEIVLQRIEMEVADV